MPTSTIVIDRAALGLLTDGPSRTDALSRNVQGRTRTVGEDGRHLLSRVETSKLARVGEPDPHQRHAVLHALVQPGAPCLQAQCRETVDAPILRRRCTARRLRLAAPAQQALTHAMVRLDEAVARP